MVRFAPFGDARADAQFFVVARGVQVTAMGFGDDDVAVVVSLHHFVFDADGAHEFDAADFKPD